MANFFVLKHPVTILVSDFTNPGNLMIDLLICCYPLSHRVIEYYFVIFASIEAVSLLELLAMINLNYKAFFTKDGVIVDANEL